MGGFFGAVGREDVMTDVFFGADYHSHLGTRSGGLAAYDPEKGLQRKIHSIGNSPFRTKFESIRDTMSGTAAIGCINDSDPQPLLVRSRLGSYAIAFVGVINNSEQLIHDYIETAGAQVSALSGGGVNSTELVAALINQKTSFAEGIRFAHDQIEGTAVILIITGHGSIIAARDKRGILPVHIGKKEGACCISFEDFAYQKLDYQHAYELKAGEIAEITAEGYRILQEGTEDMHICAFLWTYYGFPTACYQGINVEHMRCKNGEIMAQHEMDRGTLPKVDFVAGVPDSGTPHAIGFSNRSHLTFGRPFIKYTPTWPRSFMPPTQEDRNRIAKMKQIPVDSLIRDKELLFVDDSIVRGTQMRETVEFLYESGAKAVHMRSACPPLMYGCKYLNFSRATSDMELITRSTIMELEGEEGLQHIEEYSDSSTERGRNMRQAICEKLHMASLEFQSVEGLVEAIGLDRCKLCTYCWTGEE
ncbi:MAG: amidophosphoribosyltransferase [Parasporobacterium sp.]|nr:amidophosphoribosyltransferase [Parasporobacterium sp.]